MAFSRDGRGVSAQACGSEHSENPAADYEYFGYGNPGNRTFWASEINLKAFIAECNILL